MNRNRKLGDVDHVTVKEKCSGTPANPDDSKDLEQATSKNGGAFPATKLYRQLKPLLVCMEMFGLYFGRTVNARGKAHIEVVAIYCFIVTSLLALNVVRSFSVYRVGDEFDNVLVQKVLFSVWSAECFFKAFLMTWNCFRQNGLPRFFSKWDSTCGNTRLDRVGILMMKKFIAIAFLFIIFNSIVFTLCLVYVSTVEQTYLEVIWRGATKFENKIMFKIILSLLSVLNSASSMFPVSLFIVLSFAVGKRLKKYTNELRISIKEDEFNDTIEDFRLRHQNLCSLVDILDEIFSPMLAAIFIANVPMFCLVLYTMTTTIDVHVSLVLINVFWICFILLQMTLVSIAAAWINVKAHSPLEHIYATRFAKTNNAVQLQVYLFLNRLTETRIGVSALGVFVVDKKAVLGIAGMLITYCVLMLEFEMPNTCTCVLSNYTNVNITAVS